MKTQLPLMIAALLVTGAASSAESMRCGNRLVEVNVLGRGF